MAIRNLDQPPTELAVATPTNLFGSTKPAATMLAMTEHATVLARVVEEKKLYQMISGRKHVLVEGWTLLGGLVGVFPVVEWCRPIEDSEGKRIGWEARVLARTRSGEVVGGAESQCLRSESMWKGREDFALRSMAQTRAISRALRMPLGFIVQLAGFDPLGEEEHPQSGASARGRGPRQAAPAEPEPEFQASAPKQEHISGAWLKLKDTMVKLRDAGRLDEFFAQVGLTQLNGELFEAMEPDEQGRVSVKALAILHGTPSKQGELV